MKRIHPNSPVSERSRRHKYTNLEDYNDVKKEILKISIRSIVKLYTDLKTEGDYLIGNCPLCDEKKQSFIIIPSQNSFYCFRCKKGGDLVSFTIAKFKLIYNEAILKLAADHNINATRQHFTRQEYRIKDLIENLYRCNNLACQYFHSNLYLAENIQAFSYSLFTWGAENIQHYKVGFAPYHGGFEGGLVEYMRKHECDIDLLKKAGLVKHRNKYDHNFFRYRVIFPICDKYNRVIAFAGRALPLELDPENVPWQNRLSSEYIYTPETLIHRKEDEFFGLSLELNNLSLNHFNIK